MRLVTLMAVVKLFNAIQKQQKTIEKATDGVKTILKQEAGALMTE